MLKMLLPLLFLLAGCVLLHVGAKWLLVGRYKPGVSGIYSLHYVAWWIERLLFKVSASYIGGIDSSG